MAREGAHAGVQCRCQSLAAGNGWVYVRGCCHEQQGRGDELCVVVQCGAVLWCADADADAGADVGAVGGRRLRLGLGLGLIGIKQHGHAMAMAGCLHRTGQDRTAQDRTAQDSGRAYERAGDAMSTLR